MVEWREAENTLDDTDAEILREVERREKVTPSELARILKLPRTLVWRRLRKLEYMGLLRSARLGGVVVYELAQPPRPQGFFRIGILRASEYPYITVFAKKLRDRYSTVNILVYDEAYRLASDLARGRLHAAMIPAVTALLVHRASSGAIHVVGGGSRGGAGIVEGPRGDGHATTMASTMEFCAVAEKLPQPRIYVSSGSEILDLASRGLVRYGVVWEPYLTMATRMGLKVVECSVPVCCLLTVHKSLLDQSEHLARTFSDSVSQARRGGVDLEAYSRLTSLDYHLVAQSVGRYEFLEEPPIEEIRRVWSVLREAALPEKTLENLFYKREGS